MDALRSPRRDRSARLRKSSRRCAQGRRELASTTSLSCRWWSWAIYRIPLPSCDSVPTTDTSAGAIDELRRAIRDVPDFPKPGILFKDITPLIADGRLFRRACDAMAAPFRDSGVTLVAAVESRGFILGGPVAASLGVGLVPIRKVGKLPYTTRRVTYALEYGTDALEVHADACVASRRVLLVDDVLATGGTAAAACELLENVGGEVVGCSFLVALSFLAGHERLPGRRVTSVLTY
jgi:adenine phosphoribosyltransferase